LPGWAIALITFGGLALLALCGTGIALLLDWSPQKTPPTVISTPPRTSGAITQAPTNAPPEEKQYHITIWHYWDGKYLEAVTQAFNDYTATHPNVTIALSKVEDMANRLDIAIPAGDGPDIIGWANDKIGEQALKGNIIALNNFGVTQNFLSSTYEPASASGVVWSGQIWALPESQEGIALIYNKAIVTDSYLPTNPLDFDDIYAKAKKFQEETGNELICNQAFSNADAYHIAPIFFGFGVPSYVDETGKVNLNTPEAVAAAEWLLKFKDVSLDENSYDICFDAFTEGRVGMWLTGPWAVGGIETSGIDYGIYPFGRPFVGIRTLMMSKNAVDRGNQSVVIDIMKYLTSAEVQKSLSLASETIPAATAALLDPEVQSLPVVAGFGAALNLGIPMSPSPYSSAQWDAVGRATQAIWQGSLTPAEAMAAAQAAAEEAVAEMR
jgi:arabinogalactan oligomer/maltooligosaccharide transport system substrate-binding protein